MRHISSVERMHVLPCPVEESVERGFKQFEQDFHFDPIGMLTMTARLASDC